MIGTCIVWFLAVALVAAIPGGLAVAVRAAVAPRYTFAGLADRMFFGLAGLAFAAAAASIVSQFAPAFAAVVL